MDPDQLVQVYATDDATEAQLLRGALENEGIRCEISGETQGGWTGIGIIQVRLFVRAADSERARAYVEQQGH